MTMNVFWKTVTPQMRQIWDEFFQSEISRGFYLAGGTALALQLGHRYSVDLDFFSPTQADISAIAERLKRAFGKFQITQAQNPWGNLVLTVENVRVGFYAYGYKLVEPLIETGRLRMAGSLDIGLMKFDALLARASRKDFHDIYAICQRVPLKNLFNLAPQKYPDIRDFETQVTKRLVYFERADEESPLQLIEHVEWNTVKQWFQDQAKEIGQSWLS